jgi:gluconokinase
MARSEYIIAVDMGTTSTKGLLAGIDGRVVDLCTEGYVIHHLPGGIAEQDPDDVLRAVVNVVQNLVEKNALARGEAACIVFCGTLHSLIPVDADGMPLARAMIWADSRSAGESDELRGALDAERVRKRTGCTIHPLYFLPRLLWLRRRAGDIFRKAARFVSIKEYVLNRLSGAECVDISTASGTGLLNMSTKDWDPEMLDAAGVSADRFSIPVEPLVSLKGIGDRYARAMGIAGDTPVVVGASDGPCAHLGSTGLRPGSMSLTIGTSGALRKSVKAPAVIPGTEAWCYYLCDDVWILGAVTHDAGVVMKWFFDQFLKQTPEEDAAFDVVNALAAEVAPGAGGLLFFPFLGGERSPRYNPHVRGAVLGMSFSHTKSHFVRALMEGISFRLFANYLMLDPDESMELVVTGGILKSPLWLQLTADFFGKDLGIPSVKESACWGAALAGMKALGVFADFKSMRDLTAISERVRHSEAVHRAYETVYDAYLQAYEKIS